MFLLFTAFLVASLIVGSPVAAQEPTERTTSFMWRSPQGQVSVETGADPSVAGGMPGKMASFLARIGLGGSPQGTQEPTEPATGPAWFSRDRQLSFGVLAGAGPSVAGGIRQGTVSSFLARIGYVFAEQDHLLPGSFEVVAEPGHLHVWQRGNDADVFAFSTLLKYNFRTRTRFTPFVEGGAGVSYATARVPPTGTPFNFILQTGGGVQCAVTHRVSIDARATYHHLSNANTGKENPGLNTMIFSLGLASHF